MYIVRRMHISHIADHWGVDHVAGQRSQSEIQESIHDECYGSYINRLDQVLVKVTTATAILNSKGGEEASRSIVVERYSKIYIHVQDGHNQLDYL